MMEVGEIFEFEGVKLKVVRTKKNSATCRECYGEDNSIICTKLPSCICEYKNVIFVLQNETTT